MKLFIAFTMTNVTQALQIAHQIEKVCDGFFLTHPLLLSAGITALQEFRKAFPEKHLVCETRLLRHEQEIVPLFAQEGADGLTVLAGSRNSFIHTSASTAHDKNKKIYLDLSDSGSVSQAALEAQSLGVDFLIFSDPYNEEDKHVFVDRWEMVHGNTRLPIFIATQVTIDNIHDISKLRPAGLIIECTATSDEDFINQVTSFYAITKD